MRDNDRDLAVGAAAVVTIVLGLGIFLWYTGFAKLFHLENEQANKVADLGTGLLAGVFIAGSVLLLETLSRRREGVRQEFERVARNRSQLVTQLSLQPDLSGVILAGRDLRGLVLVGASGRARSSERDLGPARAPRAGGSAQVAKCRPTSEGRHSGLRLGGGRPSRTPVRGRA
ncbi:hypothetical protein [Actinoplanes solisilvae]|uniref:hypothetical protein n=1 Tax=Actinoplanes solisilvae TaxID=2486853 RepID=UPI000FDAB73E|nr:hypothetical protein [Actinoplanes solisilvae]